MIEILLSADSDSNGFGTIHLLEPLTASSADGSSEFELSRWSSMLSECNGSQTVREKSKIFIENYTNKIQDNPWRIDLNLVYQSAG